MPYAIFDLDETVFKEDTLLLLLSHCVRTNPTRIWRLPLALAKAGWLLARSDNHRAKEQLLRYCIGGLTVAEADGLAEAATERASLRPSIVSEAARLRGLGFAVVLATATPAFLAKAASRRFPSDVLVATQLEEAEGSYTGKIAGQNLKGTAKLEAVGRMLPDGWTTDAYAYSDSLSDRPLLSAADHAFIVKRSGELIAFQSASNRR